MTAAADYYYHYY